VFWCVLLTHSVLQVHVCVGGVDDALHLDGADLADLALGEGELGSNDTPLGEALGTLNNST